MSVPDVVVVDAEPLVAHADDEPGSDTVGQYLDAVGEGDTVGYASYVNVSEVRYILARKYSREIADEYVTWLTELGLTFVDVNDVWEAASEYVLTHNPALGDAFALATAEQLDATLLIGGDDDYAEVTDVATERFREGPA